MTDREPRVVVVGAGAVGLACAYSLAKRGVGSVVLEADRPGAGASWGNAGWVAFAPEILAPLAAPGAITTSLRWLLRRDSPFRLVPRLDVEFARWLLRFRRSCSPAAFDAGLRATIDLNAESARLFEELQRESSDFELAQRGILVVYRTPESFEAAKQKRGAGAKLLSREEALHEEPLLREDAVTGAILYDAELTVKPDKLVDALVGRVTELGVEVRSGVCALGLERENGAVVGVRTAGGVVRGRAVVLAAGAAVRAFGRDVGVRLPVEAGRGFSFEVPRTQLPLRRPVKVADGRLALTPFPETTRVGSMMDLGARTATVRAGAIETMNRVGERTFRRWPQTPASAAWAGLRSMTPDGLALIGPVDGVEDLYVAGGHGMLGITLSLRTGEAIAQAIVEPGRADPCLAPFSPNRMFGSGRSRRAGRRNGS